MTALRAVAMAFALYSRVPVPRVDWESGSRRFTLYAFPLVGLAVGGSGLVWLWLCRLLGLNAALLGAGLTVLPLIITGGIHMDGFCDVCDARASHQSRARKLEIMEDPHIGAFAALWCGAYLLVSFALWGQLEGDLWPVGGALLLLPVFSRALSGFGALTLPNARGRGLLASVAGGRAGRPWLLLALALACAGGLVALNLWYLPAPLGGGLAYASYVRTARREFGGTTGDLAGWFLQRCELACLAGLILGQRLEGLL